MWLSGKKTKRLEVMLTKEGKCCRCGRRIRPKDAFEMIDGKLYCPKCAHAKRDWDFLSFLAMVED